MADVPSLFPTASTSVVDRSYILSITPHTSGSANHLILSHPSPDLSVIDASTLQVLDSFRGGHMGDITAVVTSTSSAPAYQVNGGMGYAQGNGMSALGSVWSAGKDARVVRWDERSRTAGQTIKGELGALGGWAWADTSQRLFGVPYLSCRWRFMNGNIWSSPGPS